MGIREGVGERPSTLSWSQNKSRKTQIEMRFHFTHLTFHAAAKLLWMGKGKLSAEWKHLCTHTLAAVTSRCGKILSSIVADDQWARHAQLPTIETYFPSMSVKMIRFLLSTYDNEIFWTFEPLIDTDCGDFSAERCEWPLNSPKSRFRDCVLGNLWIDSSEKFSKKITCKVFLLAAESAAVLIFA